MNDDQNYQPVTVNRVTYLPMDRMLCSSDSSRIKKAAAELGCILQRIKHVQPTGWSHEAYQIVVFLVPVDRIQAFQTLDVS